MDVSSILINLKKISDSSGKEFLDLSSNFPVLVSELNFSKKTNATTQQNAKLTKFTQIQKGLTDAIQKQDEMMSRNRQVVNNFQTRNEELVDSFTSRMELLRKMNAFVQKIKDESSEMELISLNAMVVSIKSGKEGQAFSYITSNLKQLSLRLIAQSDSLIANEKSVQDNIALLKTTISNVEQISRRTDNVGGEGTADIASTIEYIMNSLRDMLALAGNVTSPILKAMECIQMQDIIRQSLDDVILTVTKIKSPADYLSAEEKIDQCCFNEKLAELAFHLLTSINEKLMNSISVFKENRDKINAILSEVETRRRTFIDSSLQDTNQKYNLQSCIEKTTADFTEFVTIFKSYQSAQEQVLEKSNGIQFAVQKIQLCFNDFFPIINNLQYVAIAQRIEVARNENISSIESTVEYMSKLIVQTDNNVQEAQKMLQDFIDNSTRQIKQFTIEADADRKFFSAINKEKSAFIKTLSKLQNNFASAVNNFTVYSDDFLSCYRSIEDSIGNLEQLSADLKKEQTELSAVKDAATADKAKFMEEAGITEWTIKNNSFNDFIHHFTIISDKQTAGSIEGLDIKEGVEAGEITFF